MADLTSALGTPRAMSGQIDDGNEIIRSGLLNRIESGTFQKEATKQRYFVLLPRHLAFFHKQADAAMTDGRLTADYNHNSLSSLRSHGASLSLPSIRSVAVDETCIRLTLEGGVEQLHASTADEATEWGKAIQEAQARCGDAPPPNTTPSPAMRSTSTDNSSLGRLRRLSAMVGGSGGSSRNLTGSMTPVSKGTPTTTESLEDKIARVCNEKTAILDKVKVVCRRAMEAAANGQTGKLSGEDGGGSGSTTPDPGSSSTDNSKITTFMQMVAEKRASYTSTPFAGTLTRATYRNGLGYPAAVLCGWLTRPSKGALGAGQRERFFVLTPEYLGHFTQEKDAGIVSGYLSGLVGLRATSKFSQEGVGWPLESIVGVQAFETAERERADVRMERAMAKAAISKAKGLSGKDSDDSENDSPATPTSRPSVSSSSKSELMQSYQLHSKATNTLFGRLPTLETIRLDAMAPDCKSTLIEIDLGQRILLLQAWNVENRDVWLKALREWSTLRRSIIDNEVVYGGKK